MSRFAGRAAGLALVAFALLAALPALSRAQTVTEFNAGISPGSAPLGIAAGPDGNLWFAESSGDRIGRITPTGVVTEFSAGITPGAGPRGITAGPDGNLWFTEQGTDSIGRITPDGVVTEFSAGITAGAMLTGIVAGPDGNLWFTESGNDLIGRITTAGVVTEFGGLTAAANPNGITPGPGGDLWFVETFIDGAGRITTAGAVTEYSAGITGGSLPLDAEAGPDGNVWFTEPFSNQVARITPAGTVTEFGSGISPGAQPNEITAGPDGALWFTELGLARIGRITTAGAVTEVSQGINPGAGAYGITAGPDGNIWFTEASTDGIGRVALSAPAPIQGQTTNLTPVSGKVLVKLPGASGFVELSTARSVPVGSTVDTRAGIVELTVDSSGQAQTAQFKYGVFQIAQSGAKGAVTELRLTGALEGCKAKRRSPVAETAAGGRRLWGSGKGRYRTKGSKGSATVRGTVWQVEDRCNGTTKLRSFKGKIAVRDFVRKRTLILRGGQGYTAPGPRKKKK